MLLPGEQQTLQRFKDEIQALPASQRGRLAALAYDAERRMQSLREEIDRSRIELTRIRKGDNHAG